MLMGECAFVRFHLLCVITFMCFNRDFILCNFMYCTVFLFVCLRVILKLRIWTSVTLRVIRNGETIVGHCTTDVIHIIVDTVVKVRVTDVVSTVTE